VASYCVHGNEHLGFLKKWGEFLDNISDSHLHKKDSIVMVNRGIHVVILDSELKQEFEKLKGERTQ
jgi:hypothetical protein